MRSICVKAMEVFLAWVKKGEIYGLGQLQDELRCVETSSVSCFGW